MTLRRTSSFRPASPPPLSRRTRSRVLALVSCLALSPLTLGSVFAPAASAAILFDGAMTLKIGALPAISVPAKVGSIMAVNNGALHDVQIASTAWNFTDESVSTGLLTGVALLTQLRMTAHVQSATLSAYFGPTPNPVAGLAIPTLSPSSATICPLSCLGGTLPINGQIVMMLAGVPLTIPLGVVGVGGTTTVSIPAPTPPTLRLTGGPVVTGRIIVSDVTTTVITIPARGPTHGVALTLLPTPNEQVVQKTTLGGNHSTLPSGVLSTRTYVTLSGTNALISSGVGGQVTFVTPMRIHTTGLPLPLGAAQPASALSEAVASLATLDGRPAALYMKMKLVPEPGRASLLGGGAVLLALLGIYRRRRPAS